MNIDNEKQQQQTNLLEVIGNLYKYELSWGSCLKWARAWRCFYSYVYVYYIVSFDIRTVWIRLIIQEVKPTRMLHIAFHVVTVIQCVLRARRMNGTRIKFPDTNKKYLLQRLLRASCQIVH